jgi:hypothetical protein
MPTLLADNVFHSLEILVHGATVTRTSPTSIEDSPCSPFMEAAGLPCVRAGGVSVFYRVEMDVVEQLLKFILVGDRVFPEPALPPYLALPPSRYPPREFENCSKRSHNGF